MITTTYTHPPPLSYDLKSTDTDPPVRYPGSLLSCYTAGRTEATKVLLRVQLSTGRTARDCYWFAALFWSRGVGCQALCVTDTRGLSMHYQSSTLPHPPPGIPSPIPTIKCSFTLLSRVAARSHLPPHITTCSAAVSPVVSFVFLDCFRIQVRVSSLHGGAITPHHDPSCDDRPHTPPRRHTTHTTE